MIQFRTKNTNPRYVFIFLMLVYSSPLVLNGGCPYTFQGLSAQILESIPKSEVWAEESNVWVNMVMIHMHTMKKDNKWLCVFFEPLWSDESPFSGIFPLSGLAHILHLKAAMLNKGVRS